MPIDSRPRRRSLLATGVTGAAALFLTGCSDGAREAAERKPVPRAERLRRRAARDSADLLARYDRTAAAHPGLAERLKPLRADVARHVRAFGGTPSRAGASGRPASTASTASTGTPAPGAARDAGADVPGDAGRALAALADAERATADARTRALLDAPPELARLLASVAAAGAVHAYLLTKGER